MFGRGFPVIDMIATGENIKRLLNGMEPDFRAKTK